jgi:hypothetical protein
MNTIKLEIKYLGCGLEIFFILKNLTKIYVHMNIQLIKKLKNDKFFYFFNQIKKRCKKRKDWL